VCADQRQVLRLPDSEVQVWTHPATAAEGYHSRTVSSCENCVVNRCGISGDVDHDVGLKSGQGLSLLASAQHPPDTASLRHRKPPRRCCDRHHLASSKLSELRNQLADQATSQHCDSLARPDAGRSHAMEGHEPHTGHDGGFERDTGGHGNGPCGMASKEACVGPSGEHYLAHLEFGACPRDNDATDLTGTRNERVGERNVVKPQVNCTLRTGTDRTQHRLGQNLLGPGHALLELSDLALPGALEFDLGAANESPLVERVEKVPLQFGSQVQAQVLYCH